MPYGLDKLWNSESSITYCTELGIKLRKSKSLEENASFLVRWAQELYCEWSTWLNAVFPGIKTHYKKGTLRIVNKIQEISNDDKGWSYITDLLRATYNCNNTD